MLLLDNGWTEEQAQGLLDSLCLEGGMPRWKPEQLQKLRDWCSAHGKDAAALDSQLEFVAYELCNSFEGIGLALKQAKSAKEARDAVEPYVKFLDEKSPPAEEVGGPR